MTKRLKDLRMVFQNSFHHAPCLKFTTKGPLSLKDLQLLTPSQSKWLWLYRATTKLSCPILMIIGQLFIICFLWGVLSVSKWLWRCTHVCINSYAYYNMHVNMHIHVTICRLILTCSVSWCVLNCLCTVWLHADSVCVHFVMHPTHTYIQLPLETTASHYPSPLCWWATTTTGSQSRH